MANKTVYPYGTNGQLPSSIGIINDLITGGADKALSAEMGKVLNGTTITTEAADFSKGESLSYIITSSTPYQWTQSGGSLLLPLSGKTKVTCTASGGNCVIAFLKDDTHSQGGTPNFSTTYPYRIQILSGNTGEYDIPSDAALLYIQSKTTGGDDILSRYIITFTTIESTLVRKSDIDKLRGNLAGKKVAVIGDSISTIYGFNTPYWTVKSVDVGNTIQSYVTWQDVYGNYQFPDRTHPTSKSIGGVTLTEAMIDGELHSFTPVAGDIGKEIGVPRHYSGNTASVKTWSQVLCENTGMTLLANASWSGSAITSIETEGRGMGFTASESWHPCTIGRCRVRDDEGNFINPDVILIYRGTNDFSYSNNGDYPELDIEDVSLLSGFSATTDKINGVYSFKTGYYMAINALRTAYPNAIIILCTLNVFKRVTYDKWPTRNLAFTLPDINNAIREIADTTGCGLIELDKDGITFQNCYSGGYITDSETTPTHPNSKGHRVMGEKATAELNYVLNATS